jgi:hypothetical protein
MEEKVFERCDDDVGDKKFRVSEACLLEGWESVSSFISFFLGAFIEGYVFVFPLFSGGFLEGQVFFSFCFWGVPCNTAAARGGDRIWGFVLYLVQCRRTSRQQRRSMTERKMT